MTTTIEDYVCNLIAGRNQISNLYYAVDRARYQRSRGANFCYKVNFNGIGNKVYKTHELVALDDKALSCSLSYIISKITNPPSLDDYVLLLLKGRLTIEKLYQTRYRALFMKSTTRKFCYTFVNPYGNLANVNKDRLDFNNSKPFINNFTECEKNLFNPKLVLSNLFNDF
jgi:hypothetical protein